MHVEHRGRRKDEDGTIYICSGTGMEMEVAWNTGQPYDVGSLVI